MSFQVGDTVGDYQIIGVLGAGGMGKVYKVKNSISDRVDALKILLPDLADDPGLADRFIREIKVLASLNHPNIAGLRTAFRLDNQLLMIMEFVEGTTLEERTKAGPVPLTEAIDYIMQVLSALGYAHKNGVIHRDIKPANMMLTPDNVVKLMDFGIAKSKTDKKLTQTGTTLGSLFYMSAEQVQGNELDGRSDLYSVGVSLYELVTGTRPFEGKSDFEIMVAQLKEIPRAPIHIVPGLPKGLNDIIMISLEKEPAKRFQTAEAFAAALRSITPALNASAAQASSAGFAGIPYPPTPGFSPAAGGTAFGSVPPGLSAPPSMPGSATGVMTTAAAPSPLPSSQLAASGPASNQGGFLDTGSLPTVMAPQPQAPPATTPPPPEPSQGVNEPRSSKGYRGLYMTLGALIVVGILVLAAIQIPHFLKTHAGKDLTAQTTTTPAANSDAVAPNTPTADVSLQPQTAPSSLPDSAPPKTEATQPTRALDAGDATSPPVKSGLGSTINTPKKNPVSHNSPNNMAPVEGRIAPLPVTGGEGPATQEPPARSDTNAQQLEELEDVHTKLAARAQSVDHSVENLRKQMAASGNNLRSDVTASQTRMRTYMDKLDAAMSAGDPVAAKKYMGLAEREVENLEKFLGN